MSSRLAFWWLASITVALCSDRAADKSWIFMVIHLCAIGASMLCLARAAGQEKESK